MTGAAGVSTLFCPEVLSMVFSCRRCITVSVCGMRVFICIWFSWSGGPLLGFIGSSVQLLCQLSVSH